MCGIAGMVRSGGAPIDEGVLRAMTRTLAHRGPDGEGTWTSPGAGLGHRRLSILDLSEAASQPMVSPAGPALTFNGEIYNFAELRAELRSQGEAFTSTGDTEVLLRALLCWGEGALQRIQGMFALGYWDPRERTLLLCRDRFGKKPLYYAPFGPGGGESGGEGLAFASELRALFAHPRVRAERGIDPVGLGQFLVHEFVPAPRSILRNVRKLLPGQLLLWRDGRGLELKTYYCPPLSRHRVGAPAGDAAALARELTRRVEEATRVRLVADVPVGIFLSGGLDSSFIAACATRVHSQVKTFAIGFEEQSFDESAYARLVARHLGTEHHEERLSQGAMLDLVPSTLDWIDEPFADSSLLPTTLLARVARREVKVALGGDGGDEILAGYPTFVADRALRGLPPLPAPLGRAIRWAAERWPPSDENFSLGFKLRQASQGLSARGARRHARWLAPLVDEDLARIVDLDGPDGLEGPYGPDGAREAALGHVWDAVDQAAAGLSGDFDAATAFYLKVYLGEGVLTKVDRATMRASLEVRAPLLDTAVVEFCLGLDPSLRLRGRTTKWLMRQALLPLVPREIVARPKKGFGAPTGRWLRGPLAPLLRETLAPSRLRESGWFRPGPITAMVQDHLAGRRDHRKPLYALLVLEHWRRHWFC